MRFYAGSFRRNDDADYDFLEHQCMQQTLGEQFIKDMIEYSDRAWKEYRTHSDFSYYTEVEVYCEFDNLKHATWFQLKYPQVKPVPVDFVNKL